MTGIERPNITDLQSAAGAELVGLLIQALASINVPEPKINAVIDAMKSDLNTSLATKADIANLKTELESFHGELSNLEARLTIRMGIMLSAAVAVLVAVIKLVL